MQSSNKHRRLLLNNIYRIMASSSFIHNYLQVRILYAIAFLVTKKLVPYL